MAPQPSYPVCDLLLFQFELGDLLIPFFLDGCFIHNVIVAHANLDERFKRVKRTYTSLRDVVRKTKTKDRFVI